MWVRLRQQLLNRVFGQGAGGFLAATAAGWLVDQYRDNRAPERLDTARLEPGETYLVTTRPAFSRAERKLARRRTATQHQLAKITRPTRRQRRTARRLAATQKKVERQPPGSSRRARNERMAAELGARFDALTAPSPKQRRAEQQLATLDARLVELRAEALARAAKGRRRPPRTRTFT